MPVKFDFSRLDRPFEADWPVVVQVPQDGGTYAPETFTARFRQLMPEAVTAILADAQETETFDTGALVKAYFIGFGKDQPDAFTPELLDKMLAVAWVRDAISKAYREFNVGAAAGN